LWQRQRRGWAIFVAAWIFLVDSSRVYLGVHYPSDVLAGSILGIVWVVVIIQTRAWYNRRLQSLAVPTELALGPGHTS
jgi:membrane-associated phospholipid phosphatase